MGQSGSVVGISLFSNVVQFLALLFPAALIGFGHEAERQRDSVGVGVAHGDLRLDIRVIQNSSGLAERLGGTAPADSDVYPVCPDSLAGILRPERVAALLFKP